MSMPPKASAPSKKPIMIGVKKATTPGAIISFNAAWVLISIQRALSGLPVPSIRPGISRNCRRISSTIVIAALPTEVIVNAAT